MLNSHIAHVSKPPHSTVGTELSLPLLLHGFTNHLLHVVVSLIVHLLP